jgi:Ni/Co efflux regulator RcnB
MLKRLLLVLLALALALPAMAQGVNERQLTAFARQMRLNDVDGFVETVRSLRSERRLPPRYITKREAERQGWRPGTDLCSVARGRTIGGDRFGNFERRLPVAQGRVWSEADLDFNCGRRGAKRLVFSSDGLIFVTVDHYETFREVPR